jgi:hypothetical protein
MACLGELEGLQPVMEKVYSMTERHEILGEKVPVEEKIFSIYERHTDIIAKAGRAIRAQSAVKRGEEQFDTDVRNSARESERQRIV